MSDTNIDWDKVHRCNFEREAFSANNWITKARNLYESAKRLEPEVVRVLESYRERAKNMGAALLPDHFQGPYFMLLAFATENLLKAAAIQRKRSEYKGDFSTYKIFPKELQKHDLVELAKLVGLSYTVEEEDLLRRLTRSAIWFGRYPAPLRYAEMSGKTKFSDGNEYMVSWYGESDIDLLNAFILGLPTRLGFNEGCWENAA